MLKVAQLTRAASQYVPILAALEAVGIDAGRVLARTGVPRDRLLASQARVSPEFSRAFWEAAVAEYGKPALSLRLVEHVVRGAFGSFEYLLRNCATLAQIAARANEFMRLIDDAARLELVPVGEAIGIRITVLPGVPVLPVEVEFTFAMLISISRELGIPAPHLIQFAHHASAPVAPYEAFFGCRVQFGADHSQGLLHPAALHQPLRVDPNLCTVIEEHARHQLAQLPQGDPFLHDVRNQLLAQMREKPPSLAALARALHMSERTLRRRLQACGTSYQALLDELRAQLAIEHVSRHDQDVQSLAERLGFADPSTFYRAFKRWTGTTPARFHKQKREDERGATSDAGRYGTGSSVVSGVTSSIGTPASGGGSSSR